MEAMASAQIFPLGEDVVCSAQEVGHWVAGLPTKEYLMSEPEIVP
jgi:hypothetical protein